MFRNLITVFSRIVNWKIIGLLLILFFAVLFIPIRFIPDYFLLGKLTNKKELLFRLLTTTIGFSGILLTVLLVTYNFYVKTTRRNTLEFITDNKWLRVIFSGFFGLNVFLSLAFFFVDTKHKLHETNVLYTSYTLTFLFIILLFPLAILSLNESISLEKVRRIVKKIGVREMEEIYSPSFKRSNDFDQMEKNPIILLKDICINAIGDKDWMLPQTVLSELYEVLISPLNEKTPPDDSQMQISIWVFFCNHLKKSVTKQDDLITATVLLGLNISAHDHFAKNHVFSLRGTGIDDFLKDYLRMIMEENVFFEIQSHFAKYTTDILQEYFKNLQYTDKELITSGYSNSFLEKSELSVDATTTLHGYWFYLTNLLIDIAFETFRNAIDFKRKNVYRVFYANIDSLTTTIFNATNLTISQKREALTEILQAADINSGYAIERNIFENIEPVSQIQLNDWLEKDKDIGLRAFYNFIRILTLLDKKNVLSDLYIDQLFTIGRVISTSRAEKETLLKVIDVILTFSQSLLKKENIEPEKRSFILYQLHWFRSDYLQKKEVLFELKDKYGDFLSSSLKDFNPKDYLY